jgi:UrcA family protein
LASAAFTLQLTALAAHAGPSKCFAPTDEFLTVISSVATSTHRDITRPSVPYGDVDLAGVADRAIPQGRIAGSVNAVCRGRELTEPGQKWSERECRQAALKDAMAQVDALHATATTAAAQ